MKGRSGAGKRLLPGSPSPPAEAGGSHRWAGSGPRRVRIGDTPGHLASPASRPVLRARRSGGPRQPGGLRGWPGGSIRCPRPGTRTPCRLGPRGSPGSLGEGGRGRRHNSSNVPLRSGRCHRTSSTCSGHPRSGVLALRSGSRPPEPGKLLRLLIRIEPREGFSSQLRGLGLCDSFPH